MPSEETVLRTAIADLLKRVPAPVCQGSYNIVVDYKAAAMEAQRLLKNPRVGAHKLRSIKSRLEWFEKGE
jgi:hypothetical protein